MNLPFNAVQIVFAPLLGAFVFSMQIGAQIVRQVQTFETSAGPVKITPIYHASLLIEAGDRRIYVDPAKPANFTGLPPADLILITDIHSDHMDQDSISAVSKTGTVIMAPPAVVKTITTASSISNGETKKWGAWTIEAIPMYNLKRGPSPGMLALENIDVAFVCMNLPYTMPPDEAADAVKAFHPKIVIPYHYRGSDLAVFQKDLQGTGIEVRILDWYPKS
jgi:L-ascorbate metabolism protein UlaG (beta-lactamase superfamily)